jgi:histidinol phosphatase-like enzyme (inositol monophosphatase family)
MTQLSPQDLLQAALEISEAAASIPLRYFRTAVAVEDKPDESPVTIADRETEAYIRQTLGERFGSHGILGEEFGASSADGDTLWVIDPIDGTRSFTCGQPLFGMLLGVVRNGVAEAGLIRMPALGECFAGARGGPAKLNGAPIRCSQVTRLDRARLFINEANLLLTREPERLAQLMRAGKVRRFANDCYSFGLLAAGHIDAVVDFDLKPHDFLPILPVVEAAGGTMTDWEGRLLGLGSTGNVLAAATPELHSALLEVLR